MRKVIVGDIHGCREEVLELLGSVRADWKKDMLIQMGDMVDRGRTPAACSMSSGSSRRRWGSAAC